VQEILKPLLLRRNKNGKLENGKPILDLPPKDIKLQKLEFSDEEREVRLLLFVAPGLISELDCSYMNASKRRLGCVLGSLSRKEQF
jgi:hypothetical protein